MVILLIRAFQAVNQILTTKFDNDIPSAIPAAIGDSNHAPKQIFFELNKDLKLDNYGCLPVQEYSKFEYSNF